MNGKIFRITQSNITKQLVIDWALNAFYQSDELTVDSPNTLIFFSRLLCSIFPPPRHLHSIPRASMAGQTFSNIWSVSNTKHSYFHAETSGNSAIIYCTRTCKFQLIHVARSEQENRVKSAVCCSTAGHLPHQLTVILCTLCASDYDFVYIAIFHFYSDQYVLKRPLRIDLDIRDFIQRVSHRDCHFSQCTVHSQQPAPRSTDDGQHGALAQTILIGRERTLLPLLKKTDQWQLHTSKLAPLYGQKGNCMHFTALWTRLALNGVGQCFYLPNLITNHSSRILFINHFTSWEHLFQ